MPANLIPYSACLSIMCIVLLQAGSCNRATSSAPANDNRVTTGVWAGREIRMNVNSGGAEIEFSCAHGKIDEPLVLDSTGHFSVRGTMTAGSMGPTREDQPPKTQPAEFSGDVHEKNMNLKILLTNTKEDAGNFTLEYGAAGRLHRCQ